MTEWQPQYDPDEHARRLDQGVAPQGYGQQRQQPPGQWPPQPQPPYQPQYQQPQPGWQQPPQFPPPGPGHRQPPPRKRGGAVAAFLIGGSIAVIVVVIVAAAAHGGKTPASASSSGAPAASVPAPSSPAAAAAVAQTVTYVVTGSPADVTYGPAGSSLSGHTGMSKTVKLGNPAYYSIDAQLHDGGGSVTCQIKVGGTVISKSTATGAFNIASCEISKDPFSDKWTDTNAA